MTRLRVVPVALLLVASSAFGQTDATIRDARKLLADRSPQAALDVLRAAGVSGASSRDLARLSFYTGRAYEDLHDRKNAEAAYRKAIAAEPAYGAALNNLAQLRLGAGDAAEAARLLERASRLEDRHRLVYVNNYALAAERAGDIPSARRAYAELALAQPDNVDAQVNVIRLLDDPQRQIDLLLRLCRVGEAKASRAAALELIPRSPAVETKRALLAIVAETLAADDSDPAPLAALRNDARIGAGVRELLALYGKEPVQIVWWRNPHFDEHVTNLIRELGVRRAAANDFEAAKRLLKLAVEYSNGSDPETILELADIYVREKRLPELDALARTAQQAIASVHDSGTAYRFHTALGTMYASLGRWGSESEPASAIYQLTSAGQAAADYNATLKWGSRIPTDPRAVTLLAEGLAHTGAGDRSLELRIASAEELLDDGRKRAALQVIEGLQRADIRDAAMRKRYDALIAKSKMPIVQEFVINFPDSVSVDLVALAPAPGALSRDLGQKIVKLLSDHALAETDYTRDVTERALLLLGVTRFNPAMSRTAGELSIPVGGTPVRYRYAVHGASE